MALLVRAAGALTIALWTVGAAADTWFPPSTETYLSPDKKVRFTITPNKEPDESASTEDEAGQSVLLMQPSNDQRTGATGRLERKVGKAEWKLVWERTLVNKVAPVKALVTKSGRHVVTFDNWYSTGTGNNVVVIYGHDGSLIRSLGLNDFLPANYVKTLPHSVGSIGWSGKHRISRDEKRLILQVSSRARSLRYVELPLDLATGLPLPPQGEAWQRAMAEATRIVAAEEAFLAAPLVGPSTTKEQDWHAYLRETYFRLDPDWDVQSYFTISVLASPKARNYTTTEGLLRLALVPEPSTNAVLIASPASPDNLVKVLTEIGQVAEPDAFKQTRIYVTIPAAYHDRIAAALARTGATLILLDPTQPIPQRAERLPGAQPAG